MINNYRSDGSKRICTVTAVDMRRKVCKCISDVGELLLDVRWLTPSGGYDGTNVSSNPIEGSRVLVDTSTGFPFILGAIHTDSADTLRRPNIGMQNVDEKIIANYATIPTGNLVRGPGTPKDQRVGDLINTTDGGAVQGILHGGTVISKASPLAQIILSRYGDMARIVSRNYEHFTDVDSIIKASIRGYIYAKKETYRDPVKSRNEIPNRVSYEGNVQAAELVDAAGTSYASIPADEFPTISEDDGVISKTYTFNDDESEVFTKVTSEDIEGTEQTIIQKTDGSNIHSSTKSNSIDQTVLSDSLGNMTDSRRESTGFSHDITSDTSSSNVSADAEEFRHTIFSANGDIIVKGNESGVTIDAGGKTTIHVNSDGTLTITTTGDMNFNSGGATTFNSSGNFKVTAPIIELN